VGPHEAVRVTAAVIIRNGRLLAARRGRRDAHALRWELPGGKQEEGERLEACLRRELREELGVNAEVGALVCRSRVEQAGSTIELFAFEIDRFQGRIRPREHEEIRWIAPPEFQALDFLEADRPLLAEIARRWEDLKHG